MSELIRFKRGIKSQLPALNTGEPAFCTDTNEFFIGTDIGNFKINSGSGNSYLLELNRWNVKNDGTDAVNTSIGINNGLAWASTQGYTEVVLPKGTYLIDETNPIQPQSNMTLNLGGATLKIRSNNLVSYTVICFKNNQVFSRVTNGIIQGDKDTHDYYYLDSNGANGKAWSIWTPNKTYAVGDKVMPTNTVADNYSVYWQCTVGGTSGNTEPTWNTSPNNNTIDNTITWKAYSRHTHEWGYGIAVGVNSAINLNTKFISVDNLEIFNCIGDGVTVQGNYGQLYVSGSTLNFDGSWSQGSLNSDGTINSSDTTKIVSNLNINLNQTIINKYGYFGIYGDSYGSLGNGVITMFYDVTFYKSDNTFISSLTNLEIFDEVKVPTGANYAKIALHQGTIPPSGSCSLTFKCPEFPKYTFIEKCNIHDCRRLGVSISPAKYVFIRGNDIFNIKGTAPQGSIDIEDGYRQNQFIYIEDNNLHDCSTGLSVVAGRRITIARNRFYINTLTVWDKADFVSVKDNHFIKSGVNLYGDVLFTGNYVQASIVNATDGNTFTTWTASNAYSVGNLIVPTISNGYYYQCITSGTSGTIEPSWSTSTINTVTDGTAVWRLVRKSRDLEIHSCDFYNCAVVINKVTSYKLRINGSKFINNDDKYGVLGLGYTISFTGQPQIFQNCVFDGDDYNYTNYILNATKGNWIYDNVKFLNLQKLSGVPPGVYRNCEFLKVSNLTLGINSSLDADFEFIGCKFDSVNTNAALTLITVNNAKSLKMSNCLFLMIDGYTVKIQAVSDEVILRGNRFKYPNSSYTADIIRVEDTFTGNLISIEGNTFTSNKTPIGFNNLVTTNTTAKIFVKNNDLIGATLNTNGKEIKLNNIVNGVPNSYDSGTTSNRPTNGNYIKRMYFDTTLGKPIYWSGTIWVDANGAAV